MRNRLTYPVPVTDRPRRSRIRALLVTVVAAVIALLTTLTASSATARPGSAPTAQTPPNGSLVVIGTGGLTWSDVSPERTPGLWGLLRDGSSATMTNRSVFTNTCPVDGWLGLSTGARAAAPPIGEGVTQRRSTSDPCPPVPQTVEGQVAGWQRLLDAAAAKNFGAELGLLGQSAVDAGQCIQAIGPGAAVAAADRSGRVARYADYDESSLPMLLTACPVAVVDVGGVRDPDDVAAGESAGTPVADQVREIDARIASIAKAAPNGANLLVASLSDSGRTERLRLVAAEGPAFGPGMLASSSTRQPDLVQIQDVTVTVLHLAGLPIPDDLGGAVLTRDPAASNAVDLARERLSALQDLDVSTFQAHELVPAFFTVFLYGQLAIYLFVLLVWRGRIGSEETRLRILTWTRAVAVAAASVPVATFLANLLPWWRVPSAMLGVTLAIAAFALAITVVALRGPWRSSALAPVVVVALATMATLGGDVMTGSRLQLASLMGLQPVVGGRYYGLGNVSFALFATSALLLATVAANWFVVRRRPRAAALAAALIGGLAIIVDGAPFWGADGGGPPALIPAVAYLVLSVLGIRMTWRRGLLLGAATAAAFLLVAFADWLRPPNSRTHLGRFFATLLDGGALDVIERKLGMNVSLLWGNYSMTILVPFALALVIYVLARPTSWGSRSLQKSFDSAPVLRRGLVSICIMLTIAFFINDSGVAIPAVAATIAVPLLIAISVRNLIAEQAAGAGTRAARRGRA